MFSQTSQVLLLAFDDTYPFLDLYRQLSFLGLVDPSLADKELILLPKALILFLQVLEDYLGALVLGFQTQDLDIDIFAIVLDLGYFLLLEDGSLPGFFDLSQ